ncbi:atrial natriuretic peptide receptor 1-like [Paramacrobiotus metropolitanus]|uniref:atrial natriuretic peptide receptor 1-like n=1 Tax=Paramacrobiotus metropolitanus TaxID=2943436 RepID=UPI0024463388|nr:atrial natriuretic peptide receptor 1-like [Paramacrobiotus metropolitanus]
MTSPVAICTLPPTRFTRRFNKAPALVRLEWQTALDTMMRFVNAAFFLPLFLPVSRTQSPNNASTSEEETVTRSVVQNAQAADFLPKVLPSIGETKLLGCILMERGDTNDLYDYNKAAAAFELAVEWINQYVFPVNLSLQTRYLDIGSNCAPRNRIVAYAMDLWNRNINCDVYFGPGCGAAAENLNDFAEFTGTPIFGLPAASVGMKASLDKYTLVLRPSITHSTLANVLVRFFTKFNYTTPFFLYDTFSPFFREMGVLLSAAILEENADLYYSAKFQGFDSSVAGHADTVDFLGEVSKISRVLIILANATTVRNIMVTAFQEGMTNGDYVFLAYYDEKDSLAKLAFRPLLLLSIRLPTDDSLMNFWTDVRERAQKKGYYHFASDSKPDLMVAHVYDAVYLYASVVVTLLSRYQDFLNGSLVAASVVNFTFFSVPLNRPVVMDQNGDRVSTYTIRNFDPGSGSLMYEMI